MLAWVFAEDGCVRGCEWKKRKRERGKRKKGAGFMFPGAKAVTGVEVSSLLLRHCCLLLVARQQGKEGTSEAVTAHCHCTVRLAAERGHAPQ